MSALTSGPFGDGRTSGRMRSGDFQDWEPSDGAVTGVMLGDGVWAALPGQPPAAASKGWGDMSWMFSPFYSSGGGVAVVSESLA